MAQPTDTSAIQRLIRGTRFRIRSQWALEGATTAVIIAAAGALASIFAMRTQVVTPTTGIALLVASGLVIVAGALWRASRKLDDETVARRIDRASNLADRLSTAIAFERDLKTGKSDPDMTEELMQAAIRDGVRAAPRANIRAASPFSVPKDWKAALGFLAVSALIAGLALPDRDHMPILVRANPDHVRPGGTTTIEGKNLMEGMRAPIASFRMRVRSTIGAPGAGSHEPALYVPADGNVFIGTAEGSRPVIVLDWTTTTIKVRIPDDAPIGPTNLLVYIKGKGVGSVELTVVDKKDANYQDPDAVALDPDEKAYVEAILAELHNVAKRDQVPELEDFANKIEKLLEKAENGEITKEQLLTELEKAENALNKDGAEPNQAEVQKQMGEMGKELAKNEMTKELGEALQKNDLQKAKEQLEKIAEKLESKDPKDQMTEKQKEELGKQLDKVAKQMEKQEKDQQQKQDQQQQNTKDEIRRLEKQKQEAKNDKQREEIERRLEEKKRELQKLQKEDQEKQASEQRRALKRLQKDLEKAAENLQKPEKKPGDQQDQEQQERDQQASQKLKDAARETGRVDQDQRKQATQKKMSSQMDDLREAMRRAKQRGNKGPNDPFNKNGKNQDFISRARGQKGNGQQWKPGQGQGQGQGQQGQGQGQGQGQNGGQGQGSGSGNNWGTGHDDNLAGDPTHMSGNQKDTDLQGKQGNEGGSTRETILAAAQKGFASKRYEKVYQDYQRIVEEVMRTEKLPSSYKYYVKRYFAKIHPSMTEGQ